MHKQGHNGYNCHIVYIHVATFLSFVFKFILFYCRALIIALCKYLYCVNIVSFFQDFPQKQSISDSYLDNSKFQVIVAKQCTINNVHNTQTRMHTHTLTHTNLHTTPHWVVASLLKLMLCCISQLFGSPSNLAMAILQPSVTSPRARVWDAT